MSRVRTENNRTEMAGEIVPKMGGRKEGKATW